MNITKAKKVARICYEVFLDRTPSTKEIESWAKTFVEKKYDETDAIYVFVASKEFANKRKKIK